MKLLSNFNGLTLFTSKFSLPLCNFSIKGFAANIEEDKATISDVSNHVKKLQCEGKFKQIGKIFIRHIMMKIAGKACMFIFSDEPPMLAKLASAMNEPAQQTIVPSLSGSSLQSDMGVNTVRDLLQFSDEKLRGRYGESMEKELKDAFSLKAMDLESRFSAPVL
ncbi:hypothetical protein ACFE04_020841 [Oxalis oulophora]